MSSRIQRAFLALAILGATTFLVSGKPIIAGAMLDRAASQTTDEVQPAFQSASVSPPNGASAFVGGNNLNKSFQLPLVRTDSPDASHSYDTIIHIDNSTAGSTTLTVTFFNSNGSVNSTRLVPIPATLQTWQSVDLDAAKILGSGFSGSATVSTSPNAVAVSVDVLNGSNNTDNFDSYPGIVNGSTNQYFPLAINYGYYATRFWVRNLSGSATANATMTALEDGSIKQTSSVQVPPNGVGTLDVHAFSFVGPTQITSDQSVAIIAEVFGGAISSTVPLTPASTTSTVDFPRYEVVGNGNPALGWESNLLILNTTPLSCTSNCNAAFTAVFYNPDGTQAGTVSTTSGGIAPMRDWSVGALPFGTNQAPAPVPNGFTGSVVVTQTAGSFPIVPVVLIVEGDVSRPNSINIAMSYNPATATPSGTWAYLPGIRRGVNGETTAFSIMNTQTTPQDYSLTYWSHDGVFVSSSSLSLKPNSAWYVSQAADSSPAGFSGSVQVINVTGGAPPAAVVELYAGAATPQPPYGSPSPTPFPTATPTATPTRIPGLTPFAYLPVVPNAPTAGW